MKKFTCVQDIGDLKIALAEAFEIKKDRFKYVELGRNKTLMMIFFNSSLRTRLSTQKAVPVDGTMSCAALVGVTVFVSTATDTLPAPL